MRTEYTTLSVRSHTAEVIAKLSELEDKPQHRIVEEGITHFIGNRLEELNQNQRERLKQLQESELQGVDTRDDDEA